MRRRSKVAENEFIIASEIGDVTGDKVADKIYLTATKQPSSPYLQNISLVVKDGRTGKITTTPLKESSGYNPTLFLGDFNKDGVKDILIRIDSGGSGAFTYDYIYSFINNVPDKIFDSDIYNDTYEYHVEYLDNYKVEVLSEKNNMKYIIDISNREKEYLDEIYEPNGKLKEPIVGFVNSLSTLYPVNVGLDNAYGLLAFQKIAGRYNADALGYVENFLEWDNDDFELINQLVEAFGTPVK